MKFDVTKQLTTITGEGLTTPNPRKKKGCTDESIPELVPCTARHFITEALLTGDQETSGAEKLLRFRLAQRAQRQDQLACTVDEATRIKNAVAKHYPPLIYGQIHDLIEGEEAPVVENAS